MKLVSIKQLEDPESIKAGNRVSGEKESKESWPLGDGENILEPGAYSLEGENRLSMEPGETERGNEPTGSGGR